MEAYYEPDSRWDMYQIDNQVDFAQKLVISGHFHDQVPEDILKAYETVEYLMAHSYYYWPTYDEAFHKVLLTIEMGVKLRAKYLSIPIYEIKKSGKKKARSLYNIIKDLCDADHLEHLKNMLQRSRNLRNMQSHPKQHSFSGPAGGIDRNIRYCVNVLNRLFRNKEWHLEQQNKLKEIGKVIDQFKNEVLIKEDEKGASLISSILDFYTIDNTLFVSYLPILDVRKLKADGQGDISPSASICVIKDYRLFDNSIEGNTPGGTKVRISVTDLDEATVAFKKQNDYLSNIPDDKKRAYFYLNMQESGWQLSEAEYQYFKNAYPKII